MGYMMSHDTEECYEATASFLEEIDSLKAVIEDLNDLLIGKETNITMWISVQDKMPPEDVPVLVFGVDMFFEEPVYSVAKWGKSGSWDKEPRWIAECGVSGYEWDYDIEDYITHWQYLPAAPAA